MPSFPDLPSSLSSFSFLSFNYSGPKFDSHVHLSSIDEIQTMLSISDYFNIRKILGIIRSDRISELSSSFPDLFTFANFFPMKSLFSDSPSQISSLVDDFYSQGFSVLKTWFSPRLLDYSASDLDPHEINIDNPRFSSLFSRMEDLGMILLTHISDPDLLYDISYQPPSKYGSKETHLSSFESFLSQYPRLKVVGAHLAGQPEHLDRLSDWFTRFPNLYVDTGSAKWMAREFAKQKDKTLSFFSSFSDRILYGTDIVSGRTNREPIPEYYFNRYLSFQALFETDVNLPLPIPDPDNNNQTYISGLNLSSEILEQIYWKNASNLFKGA
ncbi:MAG: amidohydrolase family protein [Candidatus Kariarchaeaceae archaeon]